MMEMQIVASKSLLYALGFKNFGLTIIVTPMIMNEAKKMKSAMEGIRFTVVVLTERMLADNLMLSCEATCFRFVSIRATRAARARPAK
jgi:hypothetical protein